jgi:glycosyltransferase involved in cell wall biosynthesis
MTFIVTQLGARMHYAVPRILNCEGLLEHFFTDICASSGWPRWCGFVPSALQPDGLRRVATRLPTGIPQSRITGFNLLGLRYAQRRRRARTPTEMTAASLWAGRSICQRIVRRGLEGARGVYVFNSAGLELLQAAKAAGLSTVLEQTIAPHRIMERELQRERCKFPEWEDGRQIDELARAFSRREEREWQFADLILCGSSYVRDGIAECGGPVDRCVIVPYGVGAGFRLPPRNNHGGSLRVLFVGSVGLRKGAPYVLAAAHALRGKAIIRMVGPLEAPAKAAALLEAGVELIGPVPRSAVMAHFAWADAFLLPSLCEGSATVVYEALAASLPVVCTPNTGSVVRDGVDGIIVPARDSAAIVAALTSLADDFEKRRQMALNSAQRAGSFDLGAYGRRLIGAIGASGPARPSIIPAGASVPLLGLP